MNSNQVVRLTTSCSRFSSQNLPAISEKVVEKVLRKSRKLLKKLYLRCFVPLLGLMQKYANCTAKVRFQSIFVQFLRRNQRR